MTDRNVELLAPAGSAAALRAAVCAGADAVYLGLESFNARRGADNFTLDTLREACEYAHIRGVRVYLTLNIAILPSEINTALETARQAYRAGVDAFIVQDIGLAAEIIRTLPQARLHISTQMNTHNLAGIQAALALGAKRVTLARELSCDEVALLASAAQEEGMEVEVFAHGALCVCYSGQCLMSSLIGGRSANRGMCAQACRLPYSLHNVALRKNLPAPGEHLLSPKDLCTIEMVPQLLEAGVSSLKIEGRMKTPEYVGAVVRVYRSVIDRVLAGEAQAKATEEEKRELSEAFSRGFTTAYLENNRGNDIMSYNRPNNRGVFAGRVLRARNGEVHVDSELPLVQGDVLEFWTGKGHFAYVLDELKQLGGGHYILYPNKPVSKGDRVFRVRSAAQAFSEKTFEPRISLAGRVVCHLGEPLMMEFWLAGASGARLAKRLGKNPEEIRAQAFGLPLEAARTKALLDEELRDHVNRLGQTPFSLLDLQVDLQEGLGLGFSQIHQVRAQALDNLMREILANFGDRALPKIEKRERPTALRTQVPLIAAFVTNPACARAAKRAGADAIYVSALNYKRGNAVVAGQLSDTVEGAGYPKRAIPALPAVRHEAVAGTREEARDFDVLSQVKRNKAVYVDNFGDALYALEEEASVEVGSHVPVGNRLSLDLLARLGVSRLWLSPELSLAQIDELGENTPLALGITVIGAQELMITEHCLLMSQGACNEDCLHCPRRKSPHYLKDRKDFEFPVITDCMGRSHLYNGVRLDIVHMIPDLLLANVSAFMVDTTLMTVKQTEEAVQRAVRALKLARSSGNALPKPRGTTTGHLFRGVE